MVHATVVDVADLAVRLAARRAELGVPDLPATPAPAAPRLSGRCSRLSRISAASGEGRVPPRHTYRQKPTAEGAPQIVSIHLRGAFIDLQHVLLNIADHNVHALTALDWNASAERSFCL